MKNVSKIALGDIFFPGETITIEGIKEYVKRMCPGVGVNLLKINFCKGTVTIATFPR